MLAEALSTYLRLSRNAHFTKATAFHSRTSVSRRWKWPLSKTPSQTLTRHRYQVLSEDSSHNSQTQETIIELKHYLRTRELPQEARLGLLWSKLTKLVEIPVDCGSSKEYFHTLNAAFMHLYNETRQTDSVLPMNQIFELFNKTARFYLDSDRAAYPPYMAVLTQKLMRNETTIPTSVLTNIVEIGSRARLGGLSASLSHLLRNTSLGLGPDFTAFLLERYAVRNELNLDTFEAFLSVKASMNKYILINDDFVTSFISHIQMVYANSSPKVHEYLDANRNLHRVQYITNLTLHNYLKAGNTELILKLLKLKADLNSVYASDADKEALEKILICLQARGEHDDFGSVKQILFKEDIDDETLAESLLTQLGRSGSVHDSSFLISICEFIILDDIKFSPSLRLRAHLMKLVLTQLSSGCNEVFSAVKQAYDPILSCSDTPSTVLSDTLKALSTSSMSDINTQALLDKTCRDFKARTGVEPSMLDYKTMIDRALDCEERELAYSLFEESLDTPSVHWTESVDPTIASTLDNLVISTIQSDEKITETFPRFKKIRQHMALNCSAEALSEMTGKMLAETFVGDVIELLKRELPKIEKDSYDKIRLDLEYSAPYQKLFHLLYEFVITYKKDPSFETNWVLYGELHKYFHIPFETYLPVIKFFCDADRLNAVLLIVRRLKMLSELHSKTHNINQPLLRDIYIYLLRVFGDKLFEEGVVEVHQYLKMDTSMQMQDIGLQNCILNAYSNLQNVGKARDLFLTISSNAKQHGGVNEETAQIMIKTYTYSGLPYVKSFWNNLSLLGIYPDYAIFKQYLIAHTYHGNIEEAVKLIGEIDDYNLEFSSDLLLSMHNYCIEPGKQKEIAEWAVEHHKDIWEDLKQGGLLKFASPYMPDSNLLASGTGNES